MADLASSASGNFTAAASWSLINAASFLNSETGTSSSTTSFVNSSPFTPGGITIDGIGLKISSRSANPTGTFSVRLVTGGGAAGTTTGTPVAGTTVTVNVSDLAQNPVGWYFFKFSAPVTLAPATSHNVQVQSSTSGQVTLFRDSTASNWSRFLRTTTNQAPAATDNLIVVGDLIAPGSFSSIEITMDNTSSTTFGNVEIGGRGTLSYATAVSTDYRLRLAGNCDVGAGTLNIGTGSNPIPASSTATLEFVVATNVEFGLRARGNGSITTFGAAKIGRAYLAADASIGATSLTTNIATGWRNGDTVVVASTTRTVGETESVTMGADASGTSLPSVSALLYAHSGTAPTAAELANLTRNVKISGTSATLQAYVHVTSNAASVSFNYTEFFWLGSGTANRRGVDVDTTTGSFNMSGCALRNFEVSGSRGINISGTAASNISVSDTVFFRIATLSIDVVQTTSSAISFTDCWGFLPIFSGNIIFSFGCNTGTFNGLTAVSSTSSGIQFTGNDITSNLFANGLVAHACSGSGVFLNATICVTTEKPLFQNITAWRNNSRGLQITNSSGFRFDGINVFGNTTSGIGLIASSLVSDIVLRNITSNAGVTLTQPVGMELNGNIDDLFVENSTFGNTTTHSTADLNLLSADGWQRVYFRNCLFSSPTTLAGQTNLLPDSFIGSQDHNQISGNSFAWTRSGTIRRDTTLYDVSAPDTVSMRLTPNSLALKLKSPLKKSIIQSGRALRVSVKKRWSSTTAGDAATYNGSDTRLWLAKNPAVGINNDVLLATLSTTPISPYGTFVKISGTTPIATDNGVVSFYVDCDGTAGWINVDTWEIEVV